MQPTAFLLCAGLVLGCSGAGDPDAVGVPGPAAVASPSNTTSQRPAWIDARIAEFQKAPLGNPPRAIWRCEYNNAVVYYFPPPCCDQYGQLYSAEGSLLCAPDGGLTGRGDGHCRDFFTARKNVSLVWQDGRTPTAKP